jgi:hypothetical protein
MMLCECIDDTECKIYNIYSKADHRWRGRIVTRTHLAGQRGAQKNAPHSASARRFCKMPKILRKNGAESQVKPTSKRTHEAAVVPASSSSTAINSSSAAMTAQVAPPPFKRRRLIEDEDDEAQTPAAAARLPSTGSNPDGEAAREDEFESNNTEVKFQIKSLHLLFDFIN